MRDLLLLLFVMCCAMFAGTTATCAQIDFTTQRTGFYNAKASGELFGEALDRAAIDLLKDELHSVQLAAERYAVDNSATPAMEDNIFPFSVNELVVATWSEYRKEHINYIDPGFYPNPFHATDAAERNAQCVPCGWDDALSPGNFSYLTHYDLNTGKVDGYLILGYGPTRESGRDVDGDGAPDGVIIMLGSYNMDWTQPLTLFDNGREVTVLVSSD